MQTVIDFMTSLGAWNWFVLAVALYLLELVIPGVHIMWFGMAASVVGLATLVFPMPIELQVVAFAVIAILSILLVRRYWSPDLIKSDVPALNERANQYIGRSVSVEVAIVGGRGKVRVGDTMWTAEGPDLPAGTRVIVTGVDGTVLKVEAS
ncbi:MAG: NfeD family protein [Hyphomicrobiaceae bacterium]